MDFDYNKIEKQIEYNLKNTSSLDSKSKVSYINEKTSEDNLDKISNNNYKLDNPIYLNIQENEIEDTAEKIFNVNKNNESKKVTESVEDAEKSHADITSALKDGATAEDASNILNNALNWADEATNDAANFIRELTSFEANGDFAGFFGFLKGIGSIISDGLRTYQDGVSETTFGARMEGSWYGSDTNSFLNYFQKENKTVSKESKKINFLSSTPLDSGETRNALYGSLMLGAPFLFNKFSDPTNRTLINSLIKDGKFISLTPGLPKFNGTSYTASSANNILEQTKTPISMLEYLRKNGIDKEFSDKDKRYYTFKTNYKDYFAYLETMLNVVWIKLGLAKEGNTFNLFTFFDIKTNEQEGGINSENYNKLIERYNSSIGFFCNTTGAVSESISNNPSSDGDSLASKANSAAQEYQNINYITGMGTGGSLNNTTRKIGTILTTGKQIGSLLGETFSGTIGAISDLGGATSLLEGIGGVIKIAANVANDITTFNNTNDLGAIMQSFATSNGMMVRYPNLWADSTYSKNINLNFEFTSPYGDPLSIFKYVYVPFFSLLAFGMPRQAAENGLVSPFLVRCDIPGVISSDLALIGDITWTKGGASNLWTKDGLPRAISVQITIQDLYPYLAMSKRISFLSANPSFAVFLDSMSGMLSLNDTSEDDGLSTYFKEMINRINGETIKGNDMWNKFNSTKSKAVKKISEQVRSSVSATVDSHAIPWLHNSSIT